MQKAGAVSSVFLRFALAAAFLSAVADRFGLWGRPGAPGVSWGDFAHFAAYTATLTGHQSHQVTLALAWAATIAETGLAIALIFGLWMRATATMTGVLLMVFGICMTLFSGIKSPLAYSVFTAAAASFLLAAQKEHPWGFRR